MYIRCFFYGPFVQVLPPLGARAPAAPFLLEFAEEIEWAASY